MTLAANALITVADLQQYMGAPLPSSECFSIYHDQSASASAATVQVTTTQLILIITGGTNAGTVSYPLTYAPVATITNLVAALNALAKGWVATAIAGNAPTAGLELAPQASAFGVAATQYLSGNDTSTLDAGINKASQIIETWTGRSFKSATYNHFYSGYGQREIVLRHYPIIRVERVALGRRVGFTIKNTSTDAIDATIAIESGSVRLEVVGGVNSDSTQIAFTSATALSTTIAAINAVGKGWVAALDAAASGTWLMTDVMECGARSANSPGINLYVPNESIDRYEIKAESGILIRAGGTTFTSTVDPFFAGYNQFHPYELRPITADGVGPVFPEGRYNVFVRFTAGYATVPYDVQDFACELAASILRRGRRDTSLQSESVEGYSWSEGGADRGPLAAIKDRLGGHKMYRKPDFVAV